MVSKTVFGACSTEERALTVTAYNVRRDAIAAVLIKIKLDLKKSVRDIAANPNNISDDLHFDSVQNADQSSISLRRFASNSWRW